METTSTTPHQDLADVYRRLGGRRQVIIDDNRVSVRTWEDEPERADTFWREHVETLDEKSRREVELMLPSVNEEAETPS